MGESNTELKSIRESLLAETERLKNSEKDMKAALHREREALRQKEVGDEADMTDSRCLQEEMDRAIHQQQLKHEEELRNFQSTLRKEFYDHKAAMMTQETRMDELRAKIEDSLPNRGKVSAIGDLLSDDDSSRRGTPARKAQTVGKGYATLEEQLEAMQESLRREYDQKLQEVVQANERSIRKERRRLDIENKRLADELLQTKERLEAFEVPQEVTEPEPKKKRKEKREERQEVEEKKEERKKPDREVSRQKKIVAPPRAEKQVVVPEEQPKKAPPVR
jgi:hypothetical protein